MIRPKKYKLLPIKKFNEYISKIPNGCWIWIGPKINEGYGIMFINKHQIRAHRFAYEHFNKCSILPKFIVCHKCDNPSCVNPKHLFLGTYNDNIQDAKQKNRMASGGRNGNSKLTWSQVAAIRLKYKQGISQKEIAKIYGVSKTTISWIINNKTWVDRSDNVRSPT